MSSVSKPEGTAHGLWLALIFALVIPVPPLWGDQAPTQEVDLALSGWPLSDFALSDLNGNPFTLDNLAGHWTFLLLRDRGCVEPCAAALSALSGVYHRLAGTQALRTTQVIVVSLDVDDSLPGMGRELAAYDGRFVAVTGPRNALEGLATELRGSMPPPSVQQGVGTREGSLWLIGPDAVVRAELLPPHDVRMLTATYLRTRLRG